MRYLLATLALSAALLGAGCTPTTPSAAPSPTRPSPTTTSTAPSLSTFSDARLGLSFQYPSTWGQATMHEEAGMELTPDGSFPKGKTFRITWDRNPNLYVCGSDADYTYPRGGTLCDIKHAYDVIGNTYVYSFASSTVNPIQSFSVEGGKIIVIGQQSFNQKEFEEASSSPATNAYPHEATEFALINLPKGSYPAVVWAFDSSKISASEISNVFSSVHIAQ